MWLKMRVSLLLALAGLAFGVTALTAFASGESAPPGAEAVVVTSLRSGSWTDPGVWSTGTVPSAGSHVVIGQGTKVAYNVMSSDALQRLDIRGTLAFSRDSHTGLDVGHIEVLPGGYLEIGTYDLPIPAGVTARLRIVNATEGENGLFIEGEAQIHGARLAKTYSYLVRSAERGHRALELADAVDWPVAARIVIAPTGIVPQEAEENTIARVEGRVLILAQPLRFFHAGTEPVQAEVAVLTRNVLITSKDPTKRGHTIFHRGAKGSLSYAEFAFLGAEGQLGKYPVHFHRTHDGFRGTLVEGLSVHDSGNRFITVHSTNGVTLRNNVGYKAVGHGFFLEDGDEVDNIYEGNLGILTLPGKLIPSDAYAAVFWTQNPSNTWRNNIAVAGRRGFYFDIPNRAMPIAGRPGMVHLRSLPLLAFTDNLAHTIGREGVRADGLHMRYAGPPREMVGFRSWRNREYGAYLNAANVTLVDPFFFGSQKGNMVLEGTRLAVRGGRILGEVSQGTRPSPMGVMLMRGNDLLLDGVILQGHRADKGLTPADVTVVQESEAPVRAVLLNTWLGSQRPLLLGFPRHEDTQVEVRGYQGTPGVNFLLYRIDLPAPPACGGPSVVEFQMAANRCPVP